MKIQTLGIYFEIRNLSFIILWVKTMLRFEFMKIGSLVGDQVYGLTDQKLLFFCKRRGYTLQSLVGYLGYRSEKIARLARKNNITSKFYGSEVHILSSISLLKQT